MFSNLILPVFGLVGCESAFLKLVNIIFNQHMLHMHNFLHSYYVYGSSVKEFCCAFNVADLKIMQDQNIMSYFVCSYVIM